jgi:hypothetical protein
MKTILGRVATACIAQSFAFVMSGASLRPPAVPLVTHDPYFSIWSMADRLTDQPTKHWTGKVQSLSSLIRVDGKVFRLMGSEPRKTAALPQDSVEVQPTRTTYRFTGAGVRVALEFLTPALPQKLDVLSRPATYLTWTIASDDGQTHAVSLYFDAGSELAVNTREEPVTWSRYRLKDLEVLRVGSSQQPVLEKSGDDLRIDWGYLYVVAPPGSGASQAATFRPSAMKAFTETGGTPDTDALETFEPYGQADAVLAYSFDCGQVGSTPVSRHLVIAYDDEYSVEYLERRLRPYWRRNGATAEDMLRAALADYDGLREECARFDKQLMSDLEQAGGEDYARLCALAYRQTLAAHKLTADTDGTPLYFSKENFSNGSIDTVDVTYPSSPFFLLFNPRLLEAQLKPVLDYASLARWHFPFAPHDLGRYPLANGQQYGGGEKTEENQMPVEESGNMLLMIGAMEQVAGNADFARRYWSLLTKWAEYLKSKGLDPENQLCTDDFAGHLAHNANLSIKSILAMAAYGKLAGMLGKTDVAKEYGDLAVTDAKRWVEMDEDHGHFKLAFDRPATWSQKYNLVWDKLLDLHVFPAQVVEQELAFYRSHMNRYGLPLDNRADYTKIDWLTWTATLASNKDGFEALFAPAYRFADESPSRVPLTDWYDTKTGKQVGFQARSVVGGLFIRMLDDRKTWLRYAGGANLQ